MGVTIYQVAEAAGVSPSTVSNVLNGRSERMQPATRKRVEQAISKLGYQPNRAARSLRNGDIGAVGLIVPSVANPFWGSFARYLEDVAREHGYRVLLCNSAREPDRERAYVDQLWADGVRGIILCTSLPSLAYLEDRISAGLEVVAFDRTTQVGDPDQVFCISVDNALGAALATEHVLELGHRRLAFVSGSLGSVNRRERYRGIRETLQRLGAGSDAIVWHSGNDYGDLDAARLGRAAARDLLSRPDGERPTAILAINDMVALGICAGIRDEGLQVGRDVSVTGFDDIVLADLMWPPLTTVRQPLPTMARAAFEHVLPVERNSSGGSLLVRPELVVRESTAPAP